MTINVFEKMEQVVANCMHAGMGPLNEPFPFPDAGDITIGDIQKAIAQYREMETKMKEYRDWADRLAGI